ncbi:MAG: hypothetical protein ABJ360_13135 [Roseobacter sp.]|uniref:hypothetical protein n=1 Tax=Roseibium sp. TaxID=1936156 RepID=UPI0032634E3E
MSDDAQKTVTQVFSVTAEMLEDLERERGPDLEFMLRNAHRPFVDKGKVYRIELSDPTLRISYSAGPTEIDRNKLH